MVLLQDKLAGGRSIYGPSFADESFARLHARANILSMANSGPNTTLDEVFLFLVFLGGLRLSENLAHDIPGVKKRKGLGQIG